MTGAKSDTYRWGRASHLVGILFLLLAVDDHTIANPSGASVVHGSASIANNPSDANHLIINQSSNKAIINWQDFSIGSNEHTQFIQPNSSSFTLNRVTGGNESQILGRLSANGRIMLINPAGIMFGPNSRVDVASIVASTADISNQDFLAGNYIFTQNPAFNAPILNYGSISVADTGFAALVAPGVANYGVINARMGTVVLAAGTKHTMDLYGDGLINFVVNEGINSRAVRNNQTLQDTIKNEGYIYAEGGNVLISAKSAPNVVESVVNLKGFTQAKSVVHRGDRIVLNGARFIAPKVETYAKKSIKLESDYNYDQDFDSYWHMYSDGDIDFNHHNLYATGLGGQSLIITSAGGAVVLNPSDGIYTNGGRFVVNNMDGLTYWGGKINLTGTGGPQNTLIFSTPVVLTMDTVFSDPGDIIFQSTVDSDGTPRNLTLNLNGGAGTSVHFQQNVGAISPLRNLLVNCSGGVNCNTLFGLFSPPTSISVNTTETQTYNTVAAPFIDVTYNSSGLGALGDIRFNGLIQGGNNFINTAGTTFISGGVNLGGFAGTIETDAAGQTQLDSDINLSTTALIRLSFNDPLILTQAGTTIIGNTGGISIVRISGASSSSGGNNLQVTGNGPVGIFPNAIEASGDYTGIALDLRNTDGNDITRLDNITNAPSLVTNAAGSTQLINTISTVGTQTYNNSTSLIGNTILTSTGGATITSPVNTLGGFDLTVNTTGTAIFSTMDGPGNLNVNAQFINFNGDIGSTTPLTSLNAPIPAGLPVATLNLNSITATGDVTIGHSISYLQSFTINANNITLGDMAAVNLLPIGGAHSILLNSNAGGVTTIAFDFAGNGGSPIGNLTTNADGTANYDVFTTTSSGDLTFNENVSTSNVFGPNISAANINFNGTIDASAAATMSLAATGTINLVGAVGASGAFDLFSAGAPTVNITAPSITGNTVVLSGGVELRNNLVINATAAGLGGATINSDATPRDLTVNASASTTLGTLGNTAPLNSITTDAPGTVSLGGNITTVNAQNYNDSATLTANTVLTSTAGSNLGFTGALDGGGFDLTLNTSGTSSLVGGVSNLNSLITDATGVTELTNTFTVASMIDINDTLNLLGATTLTSTGGGTVDIATLNAAGNDLTVNTTGNTTIAAVTGTPVNTLTTDAGGQTRLPTPLVATGNIDLGDELVLQANTVFTAANISLSNVTGGGFDLTLNSPGTTTLAGILTNVNNLATDPGGNTSLLGTITTGGSHLYGDSLSLGGNTVLISTGGAPINLANGITGGGNALTITTSGLTTLNNPITGLSSITTNGGGNTTFGGTLTTSGFQLFTDAMLLSADSVFASTGAGDIAFSGGVSGAFNLTVNTAGETSLNNVIASSLTTDAAGTAGLYGGTITTTGTITLNDPINMVAGPNVMNAGTTINLNNTVDGNQALSLNGTTANNINGTIGGTTPIASLTTTGSTNLGANITAQGASTTFGGPVVLTADTVITEIGIGSITFQDTVGSDGLGPHDLTLNTNSGNIVHEASTLTGANRLGTYTTNSTSGTLIYQAAASFADADVQIHNVPISLVSSMTFFSNLAGGSATFSTVDGPGSFSVTGSTTTLNGNIGSTTPVAFVSVPQVFGGSVTNLGLTQIDTLPGGSVVLGQSLNVSQDLLINSGSINLGSPARDLFSIGGARNLTLNSSGGALTHFQFNNIGNGGSPIGNITTNADGTTNYTVFSTVSSGNITFNENVTMDNVAGPNITAANISFNGTIDSPNQAQLLLNATGTVNLVGAIGAANPLERLNVNAAAINITAPSITATNFLRFNGPVELRNNVVMSGANFIQMWPNDINSDGTPRDLTLNTLTTILGTVGNTSPLNSLTTDPGGLVSLSGNVTTVNGQTYNDDVLLNGSVILLSTNNAPIGLFGGLNAGNNNDLTITTAGLTTLGNPINGVRNLTTNGGGNTIFGGTLTTSGFQQYDDGVLLTSNSTFASTGAGNIAFSGGVSGAFDLLVNTAGDTAVNNVTAASFTTDAPGRLLSFGGTINTTGAITINDLVVLSAGPNAMVAGTDINLNNTVDGAFDLSLDAGGFARITNVIGGTTPVDSLTTTANGITLLGADITAQGGTIAFNNPVQMTNSVTLTDSGATGVLFNNTLDADGGGTRDLTVNTTGGGTTLFGNTVGGANPVGSITTDAPGTVQINTANVTTENAQTYNETMTTNQATVNLNTTDVTAAGLINIVDGQLGASTINVNAGGFITTGLVADTANLSGETGVNGTGLNIASNLSVGGSNGGALFGSLQGNANGVGDPAPYAAQFATLQGGASGSFFLNGCIIPGAGNCLPLVVAISNQQRSANFPTEEMVAEEDVLVSDEEADELYYANSKTAVEFQLIDIVSEDDKALYPSQHHDYLCDDCSVNNLKDDDEDDIYMTDSYMMTMRDDHLGY